MREGVERHLVRQVKVEADWVKEIWVLKLFILGFTSQIMSWC